MTKRAMSKSERAKALADRTVDAYSVNRFASWKACAASLLRRGYSERKAEEILRSKLTRWAADYSSAPYGRATSADLLRCIDRNGAAMFPWLSVGSHRRG